MMMKSIGELVYVPSSTSLVSYHANGNPHRVLSLPEPKYLLVKEEKDNKLGVFLDGNIWYVDKRKVYDVKSD
jgi:hypothetical protein|tara:strand:- start:568 stop:783 length:216 start_codon:yes stop_codon:yes gene_type:complete